jgi:TolB-like protein/tetratricopeptide (TPR) repeat protein
MSGAVFLSYAKQDAEAARRICDALRAAGVEVWFDQSELRGGDSWDQKIRRQIRECALFIPLISASTQSRSEGYFRREWKLGVERTHDMADHVAFLVPVVLDGTTDRDAHVPERFREVQWTHLAGGETTTAFCERIRGLVAGEATAPAARKTVAPAPPAVPGQKRPARRGWLVPVAACLLAAAAVAFWAPWRKASPIPVAGAPAVQPAPPDQKPAETAASQPDPRSVAVLPFKNLSDDKENEYFSDGISEELLTVLQKIPGLHVAAQTSAFFFKGKNVMAQEIGRQLGVANLVDGSVQKIGNRVRITARLTRAATGEQIWAASFPPREVTDVFALQDEIAQSIVGELRGHLGGNEAGAAAKTEIEAQVQAAEKGGTKNAAAHELYLQGLFYTRQFKAESFRTAEERLRRAVELDPSYALAWAALSTALSEEWAWAEVASPASIVECRDAAKRALALEPRLTEGYAALFRLASAYDLDLAGAAAASRRELELAPDAAVSLADAGNLALGYGNLDRAIGLLKRAVSLDPLNTDSRVFLAGALCSAGRIPEAYAGLREVLAFNPDASLVKGFLATECAVNNYRLSEVLALANDEPAEWSRLSAQAVVLWVLKRTAEADAALKRLIETQGDIAAFQVAETYAVRHDPDKAFEWLERAYRQHDGGIGWVKTADALAPLHDDPRWAPFLKRIHFSDPEPD